jgi:DNA-binding MarR family transcriptional regulator
MARAAFGANIRRALAEAGHADIPERGLLVLGIISAGKGAPLSQLIESLAVSKQAAGQLVDVLVERGYAAREVDAADRRRFLIAPSAKGRAAALVMHSVIERIETKLAARVGSKAIAQTRATLQALIEGEP